MEWRTVDDDLLGQDINEYRIDQRRSLMLQLG
jgi:hypothetical protein